ncbi:hypothetical protein C2G38_2187198 [Gigaspora rosea]|uniref:Uncharacterized protein n=1 Tax=Gigaspora rosea TaxID=44941 RepID=A0A397V4M4_9GLOM|nr:hypothetical protein C2G38_2187198 [Gigaspora rosea]
MENVSKTPIERRRRLKRESAARIRDNQTEDQKKNADIPIASSSNNTNLFLSH